MIRTYLQMAFKNAEGGNFTISVNDPKDELTQEDVEGVMDTILDQNTFSSNGGDLTTKNHARIVTRQINTIAEY